MHVRLMRLPEMPDVYIEKSPLFRMHTMKTPTLIIFGTMDTSVPTEQGWEHFRAMQQSGAATQPPIKEAI